MTARCASCGAAITWCQTEAGKRMPVDAAPSATGNLGLAPRDGLAPIATVFGVVAREAANRRGEPLHTAHFATCPHAAQHRKARA